MIRPLFVTSTVFLAGCAHFSPADPGRASTRTEPAVKVVWPQRYREPLEAIATEPMPNVYDGGRDSGIDLELTLTIGKKPEAVVDRPWDRPFLGACGAGTISEEVLTPADDYPPGRRPTAKYRFATSHLDLGEFQRARQEAVALESFFERHDKMQVNHASFEILEPTSAKPRGLVLLLSSWGGQEQEHPIADELLARGWVILDSHLPIFSRSPCIFAIDEHLRHIECAARNAAVLIDGRTADAAYAAEAILTFLKERRPDLAQDPLFVIGYSAGSLAVPAIVHRLAGRVRGYVLVGCGAELLDAGMKSSWSGQPIRVRWPEASPMAEDRRLLQTTYRQLATLDPYNLAPAIRDVPALLLQGRADKVVASENGDLLYHRLGRPDRYHFPFGHVWLFWRLPGYRGGDRGLDRENGGGGAFEVLTPDFPLPPSLVPATIAQSMGRPFDSLYTHGFVRAAVCLPHVRVAEPEFNAERTIALARRAAEKHCAVALFPELGLSAYSNEDLFHQHALLEASRAALARVVEASRTLTPVLFVGAPLLASGQLFNCAIAVYRGRVLGATPKSFLPNYREFYEKRQFASGRQAASREVEILGSMVPFGSDVLFAARNVKGLVLHAEICEDVWVPIPPSTYAALAGATVLLNLSASNITIGKADYRRSLCADQSSKCVAAYLYAAAGPGESTTDLAWDGHAIVCENGSLLAESRRFAREEQVITADIDLERLEGERMRLTSFQDSVGDHRDRVQAMRRVEFELEIPAGEVALERAIERFPYVPSDAAARDERCYEAYNIQVHGLKKRLESAKLERVVIGVSGGLDSTHALIVAARTMDHLELPRSNILGFSMPGFATSDRTRANAYGLMKALKVTAGEIDIRPSCLQMLKDIGHPFERGEPMYDVTFENVQAGERTSHLFRLANHHRGIVLGTGDLSELALGWCTYGVGDHMSHYAVNCSVPKTLIQHLIRWVMATRELDDEANRLLQSILETEISPELIPGNAASQGQPAQTTETAIGPYELQDFHLYHVTRYGFRPSKVAYLGRQAWGDKRHGNWPDGIPASNRREYTLAEIKRWLEVFLTRFFGQSQFKRSCVPNGPKVGSGGSLSPRGDWRAPSDGEAEVWLRELRRNVPG